MTRRKPIDPFSPQPMKFDELRRAAVELGCGIVDDTLPDGTRRFEVFGDIEAVERLARRRTAEAN